MSDFTVFDVDFSDYEKNEFEGPVRLPEGEYLARLTKAEKTTVKNESSPNFGKPGVILYFTLVGGPHAGTEIVDRMYFIDTMRWRLDAFFSAFGIKVEKGKMQVPIGQVMNRTLSLTLKDGKPYGERQTVKSEVSKYAHASKVSGEVKADDDGIDSDGVEL